MFLPNEPTNFELTGRRDFIQPSPHRFCVRPQVLILTSGCVTERRNCSMDMHPGNFVNVPNTSLDRSGGGVFCIIIGPARLERIRAARSTQTFAGSLGGNISRIDSHWLLRQNSCALG